MKKIAEHSHKKTILLLIVVFVSIFLDGIFISISYLYKMDMEVIFEVAVAILLFNVTLALVFLYGCLKGV
jgi:hypothetical protein